MAEPYPLLAMVRPEYEAMIEILAPAKINLGLEVIRRREDGFHNLRTIFCTVSLFDRITLAPHTEDSLTVDNVLLAGANLAETALDRFRSRNPDNQTAAVTIRKRIPIAAGLGGASTDAAATLVGLNKLAQNPLPQSVLGQIALECGSDVPFLLKGGFALAAGQGEQLAAFTSGPIHLVLITPDVHIEHKTATMFGHLTPDDRSDGSQVGRIVADLANGQSISGFGQFPNPFRRALYHLFPGVRELAELTERITGRSVQISGAGPSLYVLCDNAVEARMFRTRLLQPAQQLVPCRIFCLRSVRLIPIAEHPDD